MARQMSLSCRPSTTRFRTPRSRPWHVRCPSSPAPSPVRPSSSANTTRVWYAHPETYLAWPRTCARCWIRKPGSRFGANARRAVEPLTSSAMTLKLVLLYKELLEASIAHRTQPKAPHAAPTTTARSIATNPAGEASMLHGDDGLASETLPAPPASDAQPPLL